MRIAWGPGTQKKKTVRRHDSASISNVWQSKTAWERALQKNGEIRLTQEEKKQTTRQVSGWKGVKPANVPSHSHQEAWGGGYGLRGRKEKSGEVGLNWKRGEEMGENVEGRLT